MTKVLRTKMSAALITAQHEANAKGVNTGRLGRSILTHEAKGTGIFYRQRADKAIGHKKAVTQ